MADDSGEELRTAVLARLEQLVEDLCAQHGELARGSYDDKGSAQVAALSTVWPAMSYVRDVMGLLMAGLVQSHAELLVEQVVSVAQAYVDMDEDERTDLAGRASQLLTDVFIVGQLNGVRHPDSWPQPLLSMTVLHALQEAEELDELNDEAEDL